MALTYLVAGPMGVLAAAVPAFRSLSSAFKKIVGEDRGDRAAAGPASARAERGERRPRRKALRTRAQLERMVLKEARKTQGGADLEVVKVSGPFDNATWGIEQWGFSAAVQKDPLLAVQCGEELRRIAERLGQTFGLIPDETASSQEPGGKQLAPAETLQAHERRQFTDKTPEQLLSLYEGRTGLQADKQMEPFKGMWIRTEGEIGALHADGKDAVCVLWRGGAALQRRSVECRFLEKWVNALALYNTGDFLTVIGKIAPWQNGSQLYLTDCELPNG